VYETLILHVGFEVLTAVVMKSSDLREVTPCSPSTSHLLGARNQQDVCSIIRAMKHNVFWYLTPGSEVVRLPLRSSGQSSWLQIQRSGFDSWRREVVGLERSPLSLVSTIEELLERKISGSGLEILDYDRRDSPR
jgi:hypothetical protein